MLREMKIIHIGKNLFPQVENNILEVIKVFFFFFLKKKGEKAWLYFYT